MSLIVMQHTTHHTKPHILAKKKKKIKVKSHRVPIERALPLEISGKKPPTTTAQNQHKQHTRVAFRDTHSHTHETIRNRKCRIIFSKNSQQTAAHANLK